MAVAFTAYFDAAGTIRESVLAVAGVVSDFAKWRRFELAWQRILDREGVSCFHMTDFVSFKGQFGTWSGPESAARRGKFILDLLGCANKFTNKAFAAVIPIADYALVNQRYEMEESGMYPFSVCGRMCVELAERWKAKHAHENVLYAFEDGDEHKENLQSLCRGIGIEPEFINKKCPAVQAADLLAWITRSAFDRALKPSLTFEKADKLQSSFNRAWKLFPHEAFYGEAHRLERLCVKWGARRRT